MASEISTIPDLDDCPDPEDRTTLPPRGRHRLPDPEPGPWSARPRLLAAIALVIAVVAGGLALLIPAVSGRPGEPVREQAGEKGAPSGSGASKQDDQKPEPRTLTAAPVTMEFDGFLSWALIDAEGQLAGSDNSAETTWVGSVVKTWIVSDYLRRRAEQGKEPGPNRLAQARRAIRDSNDPAADALYQAGGGAAQLRRMISICGLTETTIEGSRWRSVRMSARDAARLGRCVTDGRAAGPSWTKWVRAELTKVRGSIAKADQPSGGRWGIIDGLPPDLLADGVGMTNGWIVVKSEKEWQVNCLGVTDQWSLAVLTRYPAERGLRYGAEACAKVTAQLVSPKTS
ncbi:MAG TPA: hypothetical protein VFX61_01415 [Micromonosporaceae bacterium]|nr:hypothetical protein [Micromonosporaceae bacterium]